MLVELTPDGVFSGSALQLGRVKPALFRCGLQLIFVVPPLTLCRAGHTGLPVTQGYPQGALEAPDVKGLQHPDVASVDGPRLAAVEESCHDHCLVNRYFCVKVEVFCSGRPFS